jgi:hypothetical protein
MSQENVEIVRRIYDAAARHDDPTPFEVYAEGCFTCSRQPFEASQQLR